jgi:hypothetical protein
MSAEPTLDVSGQAAGIRNIPAMNAVQHFETTTICGGLPSTKWR